MKRAITLLALMSFCRFVDAAPVTGRLRFTGRPSGVSASVVVYAEPLDGRRPQPGKFKVAQKNKSFMPRVLTVPVGSTISFPNDDLIFHNVFSLSRPNPFDLGLYRAGESKDRVFTTPAIYKVFCNIHPQMSGTILVVPSQYITEPDNSGAYRFDLPAGRYRITAWSERGSMPVSAEINVATNAETAPDIAIDESQFEDAAHKNKFGQDYPKSAYDPKKN